MSGVAMYRFPKGPGWNSTHPTPCWGHPVLPDYGYDAIPYNTWNLCEPHAKTTNILLVFMIATLIRLMLFDRQGIQIMIRFMLVDAALLFMRGITVATTSLNNPNPACATCGGDACPETLLGSVIYTLEKFPWFSCGDLIFSGHTGHYLLMLLIWLTYYDYAYRWLVKIAALTVTFIGLTGLISCRFHYTDDVLIATFLTLLCWYIYHTLILLPRQYLKNGSWPLRVVAWMESGADGSNAIDPSSKISIELSEL